MLWKQQGEWGADAPCPCLSPLYCPVLYFQILKPNMGAWAALGHAEALTNIADRIVEALQWDFDAVHVRRGDKAEPRVLASPGRGHARGTVRILSFSSLLFGTTCATCFQEEWHLNLPCTARMHCNSKNTSLLRPCNSSSRQEASEAHCEALVSCSDLLMKVFNIWGPEQTVCCARVTAGAFDSCVID